MATNGAIVTIGAKSDPLVTIVVLQYWQWHDGTNRIGGNGDNDHPLAIKWRSNGYKAPKA